MQCDYYQQKKCSSCHWIEIPYPVQLEKKQNQLVKKLAAFNPLETYPAFASKDTAFRNKAKMAVIGTVEKPVLGMLHNHVAVDLCDCPLYSSDMQNVLKLVRTYIRKQALVPYNINKKTGELKFVIVTQSDAGFMLRFVLRSHKFVEKIRASLDQLYQKIHNLLVVSVNIQPQHAAILEGEEEVVLSENDAMPIHLNDVPLFIKPKSFFQTNTDIAKNLYQTASDWVAELNSNSIWDLFCGVGGFGLHCVKSQNANTMALTGIEINQDAIACATKSANLMGFEHLAFESFDATNYALAQNEVPDLVLLNPPRRGAGADLMTYLNQIEPNYLLYSSCNLTSLADDLQMLSKYTVTKMQLFDMFPHTAHMEVLVLLSKKDNTN